MMIRNGLLTLLVLSGLAAHSNSDADESAQITNAPTASTMEKRVKKLEKSTRQLRQQIKTLQSRKPCQCHHRDDAPTEKQSSKPQYSQTTRTACFLKTAFKTYTAEEKSVMTAQDKVLKLCLSDRSLGCQSHAITCTQKIAKKL